MVLQSPPSQALALAPQAGPVLLRRAVERSSPERLSGQHMAEFRQRVVASFNACIQNVKEKHQSVERSPEHLIAELALGFSYILRKKGDEGIELYWDKFDDVIAIGRKLKKESLTIPLAGVRRENAADPQDADDVFSGVVGYSLSSIYKGELKFSTASSSIVQSRLCDNYHDLSQCSTELGELRKLLVLKDLLGVDARLVARARKNSSESGLINLIEESDKKVSYLEVAVFCAVFAHRHGIDITTPITMEAKYAQRFLGDLDDAFQCSEDMMREYRKACTESFPKHDNEAWTMLQFYLEEATDLIRLHEREIRRRPALMEMYFPTQRVSAAALKRPHRL